MPAFSTSPWRSLRGLSRAFVLLAVPVLFAVGSGCVPRTPIFLPDTLADADLALGFAQGKNRDSGDFAEQLVVRGRTSDGDSVYAKLTVANIANADGRADFVIDVKLADGRHALYRARKDRGDWTYASDRFAVEVGQAKIELGVGRSLITVDDESFKLEFRVDSSLPALRPNGGVFDSGGAFYVTTLPIPRGRLAVTLEVREPLPRRPVEKAPSESGDSGGGAAGEGEDETDEADALADDESDADEGPEIVELQGVGYAEHRAGNLPPYRLAHAWFNVLQIGEDQTIVMSAFEKKHNADTPAADKGRARGWLLIASDDALRLYEPTLDVWVRGVVTDDGTGYSLPQLVYLGDPERGLFKGVIKPGPMSDRKDDLSNLKKLERLVVRRLMKPWTFTYNQAQFLFRRQVPGEPLEEHRGTARFLYQQLDD